MDFPHIAILAVAGFFILYAVLTYNKLIKLRNRYRSAYSLIDVQLKRRHDLIPNLVKAARSYLKHERETLEAVTRARNLAEGARREAVNNPGNVDAMKRLMNAESSLEGALVQLTAVAEAYPALRGNETIGQLSDELASVENRIAFARQTYNGRAAQYNTAAESFPACVVAEFFNFSLASLFEIFEPLEREPVEVAIAA